MATDQSAAELTINRRYRSRVLGSVTTLQEASKLWGKSTTTLRYHIKRGSLDARRTCVSNRGTVLISVESLIELYGDPKFDLSMLYVGECE